MQKQTNTFIRAALIGISAAFLFTGCAATSNVSKKELIYPDCRIQLFSGKCHTATLDVPEFQANAS